MPGPRGHAHPQGIRPVEVAGAEQGPGLTREYLLDRVWGIDYDGETRTLDVHIRRVRQKLGIETYIETAVGIGYRFVEFKKHQT